MVHVAFSASFLFSIVLLFVFAFRLALALHADGCCTKEARFRFHHLLLCFQNHSISIKWAGQPQPGMPNGEIAWTSRYPSPQSHLLLPLWPFFFSSSFHGGMRRSIRGCQYIYIYYKHACLPRTVRNLLQRFHLILRPHEEHYQTV